MENEQEAINPEILDDVDMSKHEKDYSEQGFWDKVQNYAAKAGVTLIYKALQLYYVAQSPDCPTTSPPSAWRSYSRKHTSRRRSMHRRKNGL